MKRLFPALALFVLACTDNDSKPIQKPILSGTFREKKDTVQKKSFARSPKKDKKIKKNLRMLYQSFERFRMLHEVGDSTTPCFAEDSLRCADTLEVIAIRRDTEDVTKARLFIRYERTIDKAPVEYFTFYMWDGLGRCWEQSEWYMFYGEKLTKWHIKQLWKFFENQPAPG